MQGKKTTKKHIDTPPLLLHSLCLIRDLVHQKSTEVKSKEGWGKIIPLCIHKHRRLGKNRNRENVKGMHGPRR